MPDLAIGRAVSPGRSGSQIGPAPRWLLLFCLFLALPVAAQAMYKWVDEKGVTHYSEHPPADAKLEKKAAKVTPRVTPPSNASAYEGTERIVVEIILAKQSIRSTERCAS